MLKNIFFYFSLEEKLMWNVTQVVSYFSGQLLITYEFPKNSAEKNMAL